MRSHEPLYGRYLRMVRQCQGKSLRETAKSLGISAAFLSDVELGRRGPLSAEHHGKLKLVLGLNDFHIIALRGLKRLEKLERILDEVITP